ncbi:MAG: methylamine utilization protein [Pseudomonadota bacterium]
MARHLKSGFALVALFANGLPCAAAADLSLEVRDGSGRPVADAVVFAAPVGGAAPTVKPHARALIDQVNKEFVPKVSIFQAGTSVFFPNSDNIRHSIYSFSPAKVFTTKLYSGREAAPITFDHAGVVVLGCNIHDAMVAWVYIVDTPWFGKSGADGIGTLRGLPDGEYTITAAAPAQNLPPKVLTLRVEGGAALHSSISLQAAP